MKEKFKALKDVMERYDIFQHDDEVGIALKNLELEIDSFKQFEIYAEDFSESSLEKEVLFKNGNIDRVNILYKQ